MADPSLRTIDDIIRTDSATNEEVVRTIFGEASLARRSEGGKRTEEFLDSPTNSWDVRSSPSRQDSGKASGFTVEKAWTSYYRSVEGPDGKLTANELKAANARRSTDGLKRFLDATNFLKVSTMRQFRSLGFSRRTYFYWVGAARKGRAIPYRSQIDFKFWLVWKSVELARFNFSSEDLATSWFHTPNRLLSKTGHSPIDVLFNYDVRRRPRFLRILLEMPKLA
ncbi:MbcA/ParS/Xre antitoxin family protein [Geothrix fuzhouensis]|uniref:MbcA/ParS/Xre antitoxin family protein n=1 Tax=Geothrix fuzhouensis TaxID=2966451 RepID=UPI0021481E8A|nr:MbcA/ParS/Xre antitoxin family protein [Geothrix fuzhouensis]